MSGVEDDVFPSRNKAYTDVCLVAARCEHPSGAGRVAPPNMLAISAGEQRLKFS